MSGAVPSPMEGRPPGGSQAAAAVGRRMAVVRVTVVILVLSLSVAIFVFRDRFADLAAVGYGGIFLVSLLGNATIILPAPSLFLVFAMGSAMPPLLVGLAAGIGEALGELTGYAAGYSGRAALDRDGSERQAKSRQTARGDREANRYQRMVAWMQRRGGITVFVLSVIPNPLFDLAGIAAGTLRYPVWRFLVFCWMGKTIKTSLVAWAGAQSIQLIEPFLR